MQDFIDWLLGLLYFFLISTYAILTVINYRKRGQLETEYRAACAECSGKHEDSGVGFDCDHCDGSSDIF